MRHSSHRLCLTLVFGLSSMVPATAVLAGDAAAQNACFSPAALAGVPGEELPAKGNHTFDAPIKPGDFKPASAVPDGLHGSIRRVDLPAREKVIALTYDLCQQRG